MIEILCHLKPSEIIQGYLFFCWDLWLETYVDQRQAVSNVHTEGTKPAGALIGLSSQLLKYDGIWSIKSIYLVCDKII